MRAYIFLGFIFLEIKKKVVLNSFFREYNLY